MNVLRYAWGHFLSQQGQRLVLNAVSPANLDGYNSLPQRAGLGQGRRSGLSEGRAP
jgi:hypothetical protein